MRAAVAVVVGVAIGLAAGGIWTWAQPTRYRADAHVLVRPAVERAVAPVEAIAEGSLMAANVSQTLRLASQPQVSADAGEGGVLTVSVEAGKRERARQIDAEVVVVLLQKVEQRLGANGVTATALDPAHVEVQTSPRAVRNLLAAGLLGLFAGSVVALLLPRRRDVPAAAGAVDPEAEPRFRSRIDEVAKRERALARRAGELASAELDLRRRAEQLEDEPAAVAPRPEPESETEPGLEPAAARKEVGGWNLRTLETLVRTHAPADPARIDEWTTYLFFLREHADHDGALPRAFDPLISDVFAEVIDRRSP
jgi:hypothetical protein